MGWNIYGILHFVQCDCINYINMLYQQAPSKITVLYRPINVKSLRFSHDWSVDSFILDLPAENLRYLHVHVHIFWQRLVD